VAYMQSAHERLLSTAELLKTAPADIVERTEKVLGQLKQAEKEVEKLKGKLAGQAGESTLNNVIEIDGVKVLAAQVTLENPKELRGMAITLRDKLGSGVVVLGTAAGGKAMLIVLVSDDLTERFHAGKIIGPAANAVGGGGGGKPDLAQAGGSDPSKLDQALAAALAAIKKM